SNLEVICPLVAWLHDCLAEEWFWDTRDLPPLSLPVEFPDDGVLCQLLTSGPADAEESCSLFFVEAIHAAEERVLIT
ncbi:cardiolipin synthase, partial [Pseudomonas syringae pv. tagetis]